MELTELAQYDVRPGLVTEWRVHPETIAAARAAEEDPRPPSYLQEMHLREAVLNREFGVSAPTWLGTAFDIQGSADSGALKSALLRWICRHETLRSGFRLESERLLRFTLPSDGFALERVVVGHYSDPAELRRYLESRFDSMTDPLDWPCYLFVSIDRPDSTTVCMGFDHTNVDGYSITLIVNEIQELYSAALEQRSADLLGAGSYVDFAAEERAWAESLDTEHEQVRRWAEATEKGNRDLPEFPLDLDINVTSPADAPEQVGMCEWLLDAEQAQDFEGSCKEGGGSFFSGVLAAAATASRELAGSDVFRTLTPFHTRTQPQWWSSLGWYVGVTPIEVPVAEGARFHDLSSRVRRTTSTVKPMSEVPLARVCELFECLLQPRFMLSYLDVRVVPGADRWDEWKAHALGKVSFGDGVYMWINRTERGVYVTSRFPATDIGRANVLRFIGRLGEILGEVARGEAPVVRAVTTPG